MTKDKILIIGGGFIGLAIARRLVENGNTVTVASTSAPTYIVSGIEWLQCKMDDPRTLNNISEYQAVVHAASTSTPGHHINAPTREVEDNLLPLLRLLETMSDFSDIPLLYLSSGGAIYGDPQTLPVQESHALAPISYHAASKASAEHFLGVFAHQGHTVTILRPSNVYGPRQPLKAGFGIIRTLLEHIKKETPITIWGDGETVRDYLYIDDLCNLCLAVLNGSTGGTFNIGSGEGISLNSLCNLTEQITGKKISKQYQQARDVDVARIVLDTTAIRSIYNWKPEITIESGMRLTWNWLQNDS